MRFRNFYGGGDDGTGDIKSRLWMLSVFAVVFFCALAVRLWYLQIIRGDYYRDLSESNRVRIVSIRPPRGVVYDRNGVPLVTNTPSYTIIFTPEDAKGDPGIKDKVARITGLTVGEIDRIIKDERFRNPYQPIRLKENASFAEVSEVEAKKDDLPGVMVQVELRRNYPYGEFAAHMIGYIGKITPEQREMAEYDGLPPDFLVGQYGLEKSFDKIIRGEPGKRGIEVDAMGRQKRVVYTYEPVAGDDLLTTIDWKAQKAADEALKDKWGAIVALDPQTGGVIAMASKPGFDPNIFPLGIKPAQWAYLAMDPSHPLNNRALQGTFPPGSTFKLAMALAGLETGKADDVRSVGCTGGFWFGNRTFRCWEKRGHGHVELHRAIVESCDVYFYTLGDRLGIDNIHKYCTELGLGMQTGVGIRERSGLIPSTEWKQRVRKEKWYAGETISCSIGQGYVNVTPIQLARMVATITNGGTLHQPHIVHGIRHKDGSIMRFPPTVLHQASFKKEHLAVVKEGMSGVVEEPRGTAHAAKSEHVQVGGKTGTAQVVGLGKGRGKRFEDHAWFVAVAPMDDPKIAVCVLVENGGHGGSAAAPLAKKVIEAYLRVDYETIAERVLAKDTGGIYKNYTSPKGRAKLLKNISGVKAEAIRKIDAMRNMTGVKAKPMANLTGAKATPPKVQKAAPVVKQPEKKTAAAVKDAKEKAPVNKDKEALAPGRRER